MQYQPGTKWSGRAADRLWGKLRRSSKAQAGHQPRHRTADWRTLTLETEPLIPSSAQLCDLHQALLLSSSIGLNVGGVSI